MASDWGMKISKVGKNAESIDPRDLALHSRYPMFKYHSDNTNTAIINAGDTDAHVDFAHTLGYVPAFIAYQNYFGKWAFIPGIPRNIDFSAYAYAYADNAKIRCGINFSKGAYNVYDSRNNGSANYLWDDHFSVSGFTSVGQYAGNPQNSGFIVPTVAVAQGATITAASIHYAVEFKGAGTGDMLIKTFGIAEDNTSMSGSPMGRTQTTAVTTQSVALPPTGEYFGISVTSQVQEIVNRVGWASGNNMGFLIFDNGSPADVWAEDDSGTGIESYLTITVAGNKTISFRAVIFKDKIA